MAGRANKQARNGDEDQEHPVRSFGPPIGGGQLTDEQKAARLRDRDKKLKQEPTSEERRRAIEARQRDSIEEGQRLKKDAEDTRTEAAKPLRIGEPKSTVDTLRERGEDIDKATDEAT